MNIAFGTDEHTTLTDAVRRRPRGTWSRRASRSTTGSGSRSVARWGRRLRSGRCDTGVLFCWTGTGASIAANKVPGVRAALCTDAATAAGARTWNDANVLVMGLRLTSTEVATEMLDAWFATVVDPDEVDVISTLEERGSKNPRG